jgi:hypothetical protein
MVRPLGVFGRLESQRYFTERRQELMDLADGVPEDARRVLGSYLRAGAVVLAIMEHTHDIVGEAFDVPGGSGILTDGQFFWRRDAADYVETYGTALPGEFVRWGQSVQWVMPRLGKEDILEVDDYLSMVLRKKPVHGN